MTPAYIALGSNLRRPQHQLRKAVFALHALPDTHIEKVSSVYRSAALGPGEQPDYLNAVVLLATRLSPTDLLGALQHVENEQGRIRDIRWGPRTLDLDLLLYGDAIIDSPQLTIPHPRMRERHFVLYPLFEISGLDLQLPDGTEFAALLRECPANGLKRTRFRLRPNQSGQPEKDPP
jgi:2-amino-4-hydroxy-6-hydroxymethyldihydropteridine diphosphokinase